MMTTRKKSHSSFFSYLNTILTFHSNFSSVIVRQQTRTTFLIFFIYFIEFVFFFHTPLFMDRKIQCISPRNFLYFSNYRTYLFPTSVTITTASHNFFTLLSFVKTFPFSLVLFRIFFLL